jgi:hypothetical protein
VTSTAPGLPEWPHEQVSRIFSALIGNISAVIITTPDILTRSTSTNPIHPAARLFLSGQFQTLVVLFSLLRAVAGDDYPKGMAMYGQICTATATAGGKVG